MLTGNYLYGDIMKKALLYGLGFVALTACQPNEPATDITKSQITAHDMNKGAPMEYNAAGKTDEDHFYLEEVEGEAALAKVDVWNKASAKKMQGAVYQEMKASLLEVYNSPEKIPYGSYRNGEIHNFWQDAAHKRGLWRKTSLASYKTQAPNWETVLDIDALAKEEDKNWVYKGNSCNPPKNERCMVSLSIGGKDAVERREFDTVTKTFVKDGFFSAASRSGTAWLDDDTLLITTNFGEDTMTDSGYPRIAKMWKRGTPMTAARSLMSADKSDVAIWAYTVKNETGKNEILVSKSLTFFERDYFWIPQSGPNAFKPVKVPVPNNASLSSEFKGQILMSLNSDWRGHKSGAVVSFSKDDFFADGKIDKVHQLIRPGARQSIGGYGATKSKVMMSVFDNVAGAAYAFDFDNGKWTKTKLDFPANGNVSISGTNENEDIAFVNTESFLSPDSYWSIDTSTMKIEKLRSLPDWFDSASMTVEQFQVASSDGTKIPYFVVRPKDIKYDGSNATLLYGYGGFKIPINPSYSATVGRAWLERGGVYVSANIRGGSEFGPEWHQAGLKTKRQLIYDDFIAVAEDLIDRKITSPRHLGIHGRSNGGLLMGVMFTQRPDLFNAVVIGVPLLDMRRYHKLLAGASWVGEYGDPEDQGAEGEYIRTLSPYHNIRSDVKYPEPYIYTSTKDDRVHPGHARKMAQRLEDLGLPFQYYENIDGGHAGAANLEETAHSYALIYSYLAAKLMD